MIALMAEENPGTRIAAQMDDRQMMVMMRDFQGSPLTRARMMSFGIDTPLFF